MTIALHFFFACNMYVLIVHIHHFDLFSPTTVLHIYKLLDLIFFFFKFLI